MGSTGRPGWRDDSSDVYNAAGDEGYSDQTTSGPVARGGQVKVLMQGVQQAHSRIQQLQEENRVLRARLAALETPVQLGGRPHSAGRPHSSGGRPQSGGARPHQPGMPLTIRPQPGVRPQLHLQSKDDLSRSHSSANPQSFRTKKAEDEAKEWKAMYVDALKKLRDAHQELTMQQGKSEQLQEQIRSLQDMSETSSAPSPHPPATPTPEALPLSPQRHVTLQRPHTANTYQAPLSPASTASQPLPSGSSTPNSAYPPLAPSKHHASSRGYGYHDPSALGALPVSAYAHQGRGQGSIHHHGKLSLDIRESPVGYNHMAPRVTQDDLALEKRPPPVRTSRAVPKTYSNRLKDKPKWVQSLLSCVSNSEVHQPKH